MFRSILVPLDGSSFGEQALPWALTLARKAGASVHLTHVHSPMDAVYPEGLPFLDEGLEQRIKQQEFDYLESARTRVLQAAPNLRVDATLLEGQTTRAICDMVEESKPDLVVMTTHGRGALGRFWFGGVSDDLIRHLSVPSLLVRPHDGSPDLAADEALSEILVPLNGKDLAEHVLEPAATLAKLTGATMKLVRVVKPVMPVHYHMHGQTLAEVAQSVLDQIESIHAKLREEGMQYLEQVAGPLRAKGLTVTAKVIVEDQPAAAILHELTPEAPQLIAMATHGRGGLTRFFMGSVTDQVLRHSHGPMLVCRPPAT